MPKKIDLTNKNFGHWTVVREATKEEKQNRPGAYWVCQCSCGASRIINGQTLRNGESSSCGCQTKTIIAQKNKNRAEDLSGQIFGKLTVLERDFEAEKLHPSRSGSYWKCQCECGNIKTVVRNSLLKGTTKSCGCLRQEAASKRMKQLSSQNFIDEIGNRYGKLVVIEKVEKLENNPRAGVLWKCKCDCGQEKNIFGIDLRNGTISSCGCLGKSKGEYLIEQLLQENNIFFEKEVCQKIENHNLRFDFYVKNFYFIEFDGKQHFSPIEHFGGQDYFDYIQENDLKKNNWCKENNIPLIRIPYTHLNKLCIEDLLLETSKFIV